MSDYVKSTDFASKDTLVKGDPNKKIKGSEIDQEFENLETHFSSKLDKVSGAVSGNVPVLTSTGNIIDSGESVNSLWAKFMPTGTVLPYAGSTAPTGFLMCQGQTISRNTYANLYLVIGTIYGPGDGTTTFQLPDMRGRVPIGAGTGSGLTARSLGQTGGAETHKLTVDELPPHQHEVGLNSGYDAASNANNDMDSFAGGRSGGRMSANTGGDQPHNNMQPYVVLNYIIKT